MRIMGGWRWGAGRIGGMLEGRGFRRAWVEGMERCDTGQAHGYAMHGSIYGCTRYWFWVGKRWLAGRATRRTMVARGISFRDGNGWKGWKQSGPSAHPVSGAGVNGDLTNDRCGERARGPGRYGYQGMGKKSRGEGGIPLHWSPACFVYGISQRGFSTCLILAWFLSQWHLLRYG